MKLSGTTRNISASGMNPFVLSPWCKNYNYFTCAKKQSLSRLLFLLCWHLPIVPGRRQPSIVGTSELNFRVRNGNGCDPTAMATEICCQGRARRRARALENSIASTNIIVDPSPRPISTGRLNTSPCVHLRPINVVIWPRALPG